MSFPVVLQRNMSASNVVNKDLTDVVTVNGTWREPTSVIDPVVSIVQPEGVSISDFMANINYCHIEVAHRWYYVTNIIAVNNQMWELHCHVDVLMTYKAGILEQEAIVSRQANTYNLMLDDGWFMAYQNPRVQTKLFSNATPFETQEFVLVMAGG